MPKINQQVQVIGTMKDIYLQAVISPLEDRQKSSVSNSYLVEGQDTQKICPSEGFGHLSCSDSSFTIIQNTCERRYLTLETLVFTYDKSKDFFNLFSYKRESVDRLAEDKDPKIKVYSVNEIGEITFQKTTRDFLIDLINKPQKSTFDKVENHTQQ
jgi:hypothetical protein